MAADAGNKTDRAAAAGSGLFVQKKTPQRGVQSEQQMAAADRKHIG